MLAANIRNIEIRTPLAGSLGEYDGVLVDAPCSASGRWRRNPEMRWIFRQEELQKLAKTQFAILDKAANTVRPGGKLVYGTCSVFDIENMGVVNKFLKVRPDFKLKPFKNPHEPCNGPSRQLPLRLFPRVATVRPLPFLSVFGMEATVRPLVRRSFPAVPFSTSGALSQF